MFQFWGQLDQEVREDLGLRRCAVLVGNIELAEFDGLLRESARSVGVLEYRSERLISQYLH